MDAMTGVPLFSVAPMMDWTDRHCRAFHRVLTKEALLYTEMVTSAAVIHGDRARLLSHDPSTEGRVAVQLGGSDPLELAEAARIAEGFGYVEINLNCGCPSDRVQSGRFGACLMAEPETVARCVEAMRTAVSLPVTVKCRIGIDDQEHGTVPLRLRQHGRGGRMRHVHRPRPKGVAARPVAEGEPRGAAARLRPRPSPEGSAA